MEYRDSTEQALPLTGFPLPERDHLKANILYPRCWCNNPTQLPLHYSHSLPVITYNLNLVYGEILDCFGCEITVVIGKGN